MPFRKLSTNFTAGELNDELFGRTDLPLYQNGLARLRNMRPLPGGGVRRRGGLIQCGPLDGTDYQHNEWIFNADQTYQLLFSNGRIDIYDGVNGTYVWALNGCPWTSAMLRHLSVYAQGDYVFIAHPDMVLQQIKRTGPATFVLENFTFDRITSGSEAPVFTPFHRFIRNDLPIRVNITSGYSDNGVGPGALAQLSTSGGFDWPAYDFFTPLYAGTVLQIAGSQWEIYEYLNPQFVNAVLRSHNYRIRLSEDAFTINAGTTSVNVYDPFHAFTPGSIPILSNVIAFGHATYDDLNGSATVTGVDNSNWSYNYAPSGPVLTSPVTGGGPNAGYWAVFTQTADWQEQMYSPARGWPHCVGGFQNRLILGGGKSSPNRLNFSRVDAPFNFDVGTGADPDAISIGVSGRRTPTIQSVIGAQHVQIFTSEGEYYIPTNDNSSALTPGTISVKPQTFYGIQNGLPAIEFDGATLFISKNGGHLRQLVFSQDGYSAPDLSFVSHHLFVNPIWLAVQMEDSDQAAATALVVNNDGTIANLTMMKSEKIAAWALHSTQGQFITACAVDSRAFFVVRRTINGVNRTWLEKLDRSRMLDGSRMATYVGRAGQGYVWGNLGHFAGHTINIVVNGTTDIGPHTVTGAGQVTITSRADTVEGGLSFTPEVLTLPAEMVLPEGPTPGEMRRVISAHVRVKDTYGLKIRNNKMPALRAEADMGLPPPVTNGHVYVAMLGWDDKGQVLLTQYGNAPFTLLSLNMELEF